MKIFLLFATLGLPLSAGAAPSAFSLDEIPGRIREHNRDLAAARVQIREAAGRHRQSGRLANPTLEIEAAGQANGPGSTYAAALSQRFPMTARLRHERAASQAELAAVEAEVSEAERTLIAQAQLGAVRWLAIEAVRAMQQHQRRVRRELADLLARRAAAGEVSTLEAAMVELDAREGECEMARLDAQQEALAGELRPLLGLAADARLRIAGSLGAPGKLPPQARSAPERPDLRAQRHHTDAAREQVAVQRSSRFEDVAIGPIVRRDRFEDAPGGVAADDLVGLRVSIPLPLWNANQGAIAEAEARHERMRIQGEARQRAVEAEIHAARAEMALLQKQIHELDDHLLPKAAEIEQQLRALFDAAQMPLSELLRARDQHLSLLQERLDALRDYHLARVRYYAAVGEPLPSSK
jgi:cobalt-zinc-cadmium efflux system outer membrane protein